jgi:tetratricopeptide (TPR) repeat protein
MSDPLRTDSINAPEPRGDAERDAKIESLLLAGLDHYFSSGYTQAIDVWTRALFLDRNHARARAYIERARSALAEQQRESEELLHSGIAAFEAGQMEPARQLLNAAVQRGGAHDVALAFLTRIDRISAAAPATAVAPATVPAKRVTLPVRAPVRHPTLKIAAGVGAIVAAAALAYTLTSWDRLRAWMPGLNGAADTGAIPVAPPREVLIVTRSSELAMDRARALSASGRLHDALRALELVRPTDPLRGSADQLKETIQRELLAHASALPSQ